MPFKSYEGRGKVQMEQSREKIGMMKDDTISEKK